MSSTREHIEGLGLLQIEFLKESEITGEGWNGSNIRRNWGNSRWNALAQAGLIVHHRTGNRVHYTITGAGLTLLKRTVNNI